MTVDAIRLLQEAEQFAENKNKEAEAKKQLAQAREERLKAFKKSWQKRSPTKRSNQPKIAAELVQSKEPLLAKTKAEVETLRTIPNELKEEALAIIINKVVT